MAGVVWPVYRVIAWASAPLRKACVTNSARIADGIRPDERAGDAEELKEARKRIRLLEQEAEVMRRAVAYLSKDVNPK